MCSLPALVKSVALLLESLKSLAVVALFGPTVGPPFEFLNGATLNGATKEAENVWFPALVKSVHGAHAVVAEGRAAGREGHVL